MNNTLTKLAEYLEKQNFKCSSSDDNEDVLWVRIGMPHHELAPLFFVDFEEESGMLLIMVNNMIKFKSANGDIMTKINFFNSDPENFNCKMFIDVTGELVVNNSSIISGDHLVPKIVDRIDLTVRAIDRHFGNFEESLSAGKNEAE